LAQTSFNLLNKSVKNSDKSSNLESIDANIAEELRNPQETFRTFMNSMESVKKGETSSFLAAIKTIDLSHISPTSKNSIGKITAERLINTIDRLSKVHFQQIPTVVNGETWYFRKQTININNQVKEVEIAIHKTKEGWKFTPETVNSIEDYYHSVEKLPTLPGVTPLKNWKTSFKSKFPDWTSENIFLLKNGQWLGLVLILILSCSIFFFVRISSRIYLKRHADNVNRYKSTLPLGFLAFNLCFKFTIIFLELDNDFLEAILRINYILIAISIVWAALKMVDFISFQFEKSAIVSENKFDNVLVPMLKKTAKVLVIAFGGLLVAHSLTFDVASILAGLGIGGVAVALAAKDTISNLFGSITVILDRPFNIGDYVVLDKNVEGTVEQVGFRSTRIRTPTNSLVTMPNSVLANLPIDNYGMRSYKRFKTVLQIEYGISEEKIQQFVTEIRHLIYNNNNIEKRDVQANVYVHELGESSINILISVFFIAPTATIELEERHQFILRIIRLANDLEVNFAYPTRTLLMKQELQSEIPARI
jgi:MscS family membrane protein